MSKKRIHILSAVNAGNVSKTGATYTIRDVCGAVNDIVMNSRLYPADQLAAGVASLEGKPAPAGHPKNAAGQHISALNGEALATAWIGSYVKNARHENGKTLADVVVNEAQARAHPDGVKLIERLDAAIAGTNSQPIHVSTGLMLEEVKANGESLGKRYTSVATSINYDHLAILLHESGAGTPAEGVGMFLNSAGQSERVEIVTVDTTPADKRRDGFAGWLRRLLGNSDELSFERISEGLRALLPADAYPTEVFQRYLIWKDYVAEKLYQQDYAVSSEGVVELLGTPVEVVREIEYKPVENHEKEDTVKTKIIAALNAAGIANDGMDDEKLLQAYNALQVKPHVAALTAANSKIAEIELTANAATAAELNTLAASLAVNTSLTAADFAAMGLERCKELAGKAKAAPIVVANAGTPLADEFAGYDINAHTEGVK